MDKLTTTIQREWLKAIISGDKSVENRQVKRYWTERLRKVRTPFLLRLINGMSKRAPEVTVVIDRVRKKGRNYELHIQRVVRFKNWDKRRGRPTAV